MVQLVLEKSTPSSKGGYINTWSTLVATALGIMYGGKTVERYHNKSQNALTPGITVNVDLSQFNIVEDTFIGKDGETVSCKWLHAK